MCAASNDWPDGDYTSVPFRLYTDPDIFAAEMRRIFHGDGWSYAGLEAELPSVGDFKTTVIGTRSVVLARDDDGSIHAFENQCAHRGVKFCRREFGNARFFVCPYHQWSYDRRGNLRGVPFINGVKGKGGMPEGFSRDDHGLPRLAVTQRNGVIFVSFDAAAPPLREYLGAQNLHYFDRVFDGRSLRVLGYARQLIPGNWKLMFENIKDPYHASLLHVFLVTFGLFRADQESQVKMDDSGGHATIDFAARRAETLRAHARHGEPQRGLRTGRSTAARSGP